jgi:hypothetical protein
MSEEFDDDAQDIPAAAPKSPLVNPKLIIILVVLVTSTLDLLCRGLTCSYLPYFGAGYLQYFLHLGQKEA